ncbi:hypothetical protein [Pseudonocardia sp. HH130630-07]|uniref:hypothetical protein n=1 Tax=Pseudonocardia sp. HH130630-07 TaxID=1690815 RepID=UPI000839C86F|nr:hypothetical protein [Pseudonocardia sp. HH130630-07]
MSPEHVTAMNALLRDDPTVRAACARVPGRRVLAYRLADGPGGRDVHWTVTVGGTGGTVRFGLDEVPDPDVLVVGEWPRMIRATRASRDGVEQDPGCTAEGDTAVLAEIGEALAVARAVATLPVEFPELPGERHEG